MRILHAIVLGYSIKYLIVSLFNKSVITNLFLVHPIEAINQLILAQR
jgi:hypothetical protein